MKRKVIKHGPSTLIISLPMPWAKKYDVKKGDELEVEEEGARIIVTTGKEKKIGEVEVDVTKLDRTSLMYLIRSLYKLGYDEIRLSFKSQSVYHYRKGKECSVISVIHEEVNRLTGVEIMQQKENFCVIKSLSEMAFSEFEPILRRVFLLLIDMSNDLITGAEKNDLVLLETLEEKHNTITKFLSFCMRLLNKKGYSDHKKTLILYNTVAILDKVLDVLKNAGRNLVNLNAPMSPKAMELIKKTHKSIVNFYELFYKYDNANVLRIAELRDNVLKEILANYNQLTKKELVVINNLAPLLELIVALTESKMALEY